MMQESLNRFSLQSVPRPEYPRPDFVRAEWQNLNGVWEYKTDRPVSGEDREFFKPECDVFDERIIVPFCRESKLSGIGDTDFCNCVWYRKSVTLTRLQKQERRTILHIGACDYHTKLWVNGIYIGEHIGGYVSFSFDVSDAVTEGDNLIVMRVGDDVRSGRQPGGKQCPDYASRACSYTRTTGIWQTVWLEWVPVSYIKRVKFYPDIAEKKLNVEAWLAGEPGLTLTAEATYGDTVEGKTEKLCTCGYVRFDLPLSNLHLWEIGCGRLYNLRLSYGEDRVDATFGMRQIESRDGILYLNGKPVFMRLVLDQGFYPDGIYTARDDAELEADIDRSLAMGFNGARLHQKVFEPRFLHYCDKKGYIVWGEHANWDLDIGGQNAYEAFIPEWCEVLKRDFNHPSIIGWCPLNETQHNTNERFVRLLAEVTRQYDPTRLFIDSSGWMHYRGVSDIYDLHLYEQNPEVFAQRLAPLAEGKTIDLHWHLSRNYAYDSDCTFVSEYGGIRWADESAPGWGYGEAPLSPDDFLQRFKGLTEVIMNHPHIGGLCYTQLTDVEQELNGLYTYDRHAKFPPEFFKKVLSQPAAIEKQD